MPVPTTPLCTVDCIIDLVDHPLHRVDRPALVLIERRYPPHGWALPGGFVDLGEPLGHAAAREALEETSLSIELTEQFFAYSSPDRDPRRHTVSTVLSPLPRACPRLLMMPDESTSSPKTTSRHWPSITTKSSPIISRIAVPASDQVRTANRWL